MLVKFPSTSWWCERYGYRAQSILRRGSRQQGPHGRCWPESPRSHRHRFGICAFRLDTLSSSLHRDLTSGQLLYFLSKRASIAYSGQVHSNMCVMGLCGEWFS